MSNRVSRLPGRTLLAVGALFILLFAAAPGARAADEVPPGNAELKAPTRQIDSLATDSATSARVENRNAAIRAQIEKQKRHWPQPTVTLVKSMVVPGWGQLTNRRYFKAALAIGLETWFIVGAASEWHKADDALADFRRTGDYNSFLLYDFHNGNRNDYLWSLGVTVFISMFDAYVDAHLRPYQHDEIPGVKPPPGVAVVLWSF